MSLSRWLTLIAVLVGLGVLQVAQRNALFLKGYALGDRSDRVHAQETEVSWLNTRVLGLASPTRLSHVAQERNLKLVAWSTLSPAGSMAGTIPSDGSPGTVARGPSGLTSPDKHAVLDNMRQAMADDTSD
jgi:hypothetical protein